MATVSVLQSKAVEEVRSITGAGATTTLAPPVFCSNRNNLSHHHHHHYNNLGVMDPDSIGNNGCRACFATSDSLFVDWRAGDLVCTSCGVVQQGHLMETRPEWREYNDDNDGGASGAAARCGLVPDDATKWLGGLQPTTLSSYIYGGSASAAATVQRTTTICGMTSTTTTDTTSAKSKKESSTAVIGRGGDVRKLLLKINNKIDRRMEKMHSTALQNAKLSTLIRKRQLCRRRSMETANNNGNDTTTCDEYDDDEDDEDNNTNHDGIHLDHEQLILQEEENVLAATSALYADKWSLERAIQLFGSDHEQQQQSSSSSSNNHQEPRLDATLTKASCDLYRAYTILVNASQRLHLPDLVTNEVSSIMCRYAARRDGLIVRGVSSRFQPQQGKKLHHQRSRSNSISESEKQAQDALREYNILKQIGSLTAGLLFYTCRNLGWPRTMVQVCESIQPTLISSAASSVSTTTMTTSLACPLQQEQLHTKIQKEGDQFIQKKHCSRAMNEIKETFPEYAHTIMTKNNNVLVTTAGVVANNTNIDNTDVAAAAAAAANITAEGNFVEHAIRNLRLPPVAEASVRTLVFYCRKQSWAGGSNSSSSNLSTVCAAVSYFVCLSGETMQRLALQTTKTKQLIRPSKSFRQAGNKRFKFSRQQQETVQVQAQQRQQLSQVCKPKAAPCVTTVKDPPSSSTAVRRDPSHTASSSSVTVTAAEEKKDDDTYALLLDDSTHSLLLQKDEQQDASDEQRAYEMRRVWDAWKEQTPWRRTKAEIEQSCGVSRMILNDYFKMHVFPQRFTLLKILATATKSSVNDEWSNDNDCKTSSETMSTFLNQTPLASVLLSHITLAAPVIKEESN